ncbi:hypothetical protein ABZ383_00790 [Streptomyces sp. NPDC005900]|uniref:hypothetical protein n=1 Tax=Streptomyces sp. NPDC005900 TaxID=3154569 RepID=UPI0033DF7A12
MSALTGLASSAGSGLGTVAAEEVRRLARERLGASAEGSAALAQLDEEPAAPGAQEEARAHITTAIANDPQFERRLRDALRSSDTRAEGDINTITIGGGVKRSTIAIGPVTFPNTPSVRVSLTALVAVLALLVVFGLYSGVKALTDNGSDTPPSLGSTSGGQQSPGSLPNSGADTETGARGKGEDRKLEPVTERSKNESILPNVGDVLAGWSLEKPASTVSGISCKTSCGGILWESDASFVDPSASSFVRMRVISYRSDEAAQSGFGELRAWASKKLTNDYLENRPMSMTTVGEQSAAFASRGMGGEGAEYGMVSLNRAGTIVARITYRGRKRELDADVLFAYTKLLDERARQVQSGDTPTAAATPQ